MRRPRGAPLSLEHDTTEAPGPLATPCRIWRWSTKPTAGGKRIYGQVAVKNSHPITAHRAFYEKFVGRVPRGHDVDHLCRVHLCVNPYHLQAVTRAENAHRGAKPKLTKREVVVLKEYLAYCVDHKRKANGAGIRAAFAIDGHRAYAIRRGHLWSTVTLQSYIKECK